jgi:hypothetical protein
VLLAKNMQQQRQLFEQPVGQHLRPFRAHDLFGKQQTEMEMDES